ncbi:spiro-SPASM protein [Treponema sp. TIM-1]|uniref:spiro-SPASM protein n=1 Tax=Treponema sp. TIM-1 TaxID=2898417 RepID=UPI0039805E56
MNALAVLYGGSLSEAALENVFSGKNALECALERAGSFPGVNKIVLLAGEDLETGKVSAIPGQRYFEGITRPVWTKKLLLDTLADISQGFDLTYYAWADCPLLDPILAGTIQERHTRYGAEYSYADGWPYGLAPELLSPGTAGILSKILGDSDEPVERDAIFSVIQRDINSFDIETEISPVDLRQYRLNLTADSKRNLLILTRLIGAGLSGVQGVEGILAEKPELLRTLPNFYPIQVSGPCPQQCELCPYPRLGPQEGFMDIRQFESLLDKIIGFSGDGVIDLSLWGELSLHPHKEELIRLVLDRPSLSLVIETSGIGWKPEGLEALAAESAQAKKRKTSLAPLSWIVSLDAQDPEHYRKLRGQGYTEAMECAKKLVTLFPRDAYVQAVRVKGFEDDIEQFYRTWKKAGARIIIQKYDSFCGFLPDLQASDLSPIQRRPCWHLMRDMAITLDGTVPLCREELSSGRSLGNALRDPLELIWSRGEKFYMEQCIPEYSGLCARCDEYYTYNF